MVTQIIEIKSRLKEGIEISVESYPLYLGGPWAVSLVTERNQFPYWLRWNGADMEDLLAHCLNYLNGKEDQPHGNTKINPKEWQKN